MFKTAVLRTENVICPGLICRKPKVRLQSGDTVLLNPVGRDEETMEHILRRQRQFYGLPNGHSEGITLFAIFVPEGPGPLPRYHVDIHRVLWRIPDIIEIHPAEIEHEDNKYRRDDCPDYFERNIFPGLPGNRMPLSVISVKKNQHRHRNRHQEHHAGADNNHERRLYFSCYIGWS